MPVAHCADTAPERYLVCSPGPGLGFARAPDSPELRLSGAFTIEAWVRAAVYQNYSSFPMILSKPCSNRINGESNYSLFMDYSGTLTFRVTSTNGTRDATWGGNLRDFAWHHIAGVRTYATGSDSITLYIDGGRVTATSISGDGVWSTDSLCFGALTFGNSYEGNHFQGSIDEVRIWNVARTQSQLGAHMFRTLNWADGLVGSWHFDYTNTELISAFMGTPAFTRSYYLNSAGGAPAYPYGDAGLGLSDLGLSHGSGFSVVDRIAIVDSGLAANGAVPLANGNDAIDQTRRNGQSTSDAIDIWSPVPPAHEMGNAVLNPATGGLNIVGYKPVVAMTSRGNIVFPVQNKAVALETAGFLTVFDCTLPLFPVDKTDTVPTALASALIVDPQNPNQLFLLGELTVGIQQTDDEIQLFNCADSGAVFMVLSAPLGFSSPPPAPHDLVKSGAYLYASFADSLRIFHYHVVGIHQVAHIDRVPGAWYIGPSAALGIGRGYLLVASNLPAAKFRVYDIKSPTTPVLKTEFFLEEDRPNRMSIGGDFAYISGPNGIQAVDFSSPLGAHLVGSYYTDSYSAGSPASCARADTVQATAGVSGVYILRNNAYHAVGVDAAPISADVGRMVVSPSPSRGASKASFRNSSGGPVRVRIYDIGGKLVRNLGDAAMSAGSHTVQWDGKGADGRHVAAGMYVWKVSAPGAEITGRVVVLR